MRSLLPTMSRGSRCGLRLMCRELMGVLGSNTDISSIMNGSTSWNESADFVFTALITLPSSEWTKMEISVGYQWNCQQCGSEH